MAAASLDLPVVGLASSDLQSAAKSIRKACVECGFFYVTNHGIEDGLLETVFPESKKFFELPLEEKMVLKRNSSHRGYTPPYAEKEARYLVQIPRITSKRILSLIALSLDLDAEFFQNIGALNCPSAFLRLLHYPVEVSESDHGNYGASAHSDYGMITLLKTDGTPGLQICREKDRHPQLWQDVHHIDGALIVNIGDLLERWTNCVFRSTLHRVVAVGKERYSAAFFLHPNPDLVVQCLESCCCEAYPPRFPPIRSGNYLKERISSTYK